MLLSAYERETVINYNQNDQEASIYTFDPKLIVRLEKLASKYPQMFRLEHKGKFPRNISLSGNRLAKNVGRPQGSAPFPVILHLHQEESIPQQKPSRRIENNRYTQCKIFSRKNQYPIEGGYYHE